MTNTVFCFLSGRFPFLCSTAAAPSRTLVVVSGDVGFLSHLSLPFLFYFSYFVFPFLWGLRASLFDYADWTCSARVSLPFVFSHCGFGCF